MQRTWDEEMPGPDTREEPSGAPEPGPAFCNLLLPPVQLADEHGLMRVAAAELSMQAERAPQWIDITERVSEFVARCGIGHGQLLVHSLHTTAGVLVNEHEPLLHEDAADWLERLAPIVQRYRHDDPAIRRVNVEPGEPANGHAHLRQMLLGGTVILPVVRGRVALGTWQRIFFVELDSARPRRIVLQLAGVRGF